jgi:putative hemolysin
MEIPTMQHQSSEALALTHPFATQEYKPPPHRVRIDFSNRRYRVHTVSSDVELAQVFQLRRDVFLAEYGGKNLALLNSRDEFDDSSDMLVISDLATATIVGAYRLLASPNTHRFYSETEFNLGAFRHAPGLKLELSRACIAPAYRNGAVISLLWKGLAEYASLIGADYLFGLSSIATINREAAGAMFADFSARGLVDLSFGITPLASATIEDLTYFAQRAAFDGRSGADAQDLVPSLLKTYIKAGAKLCSYPVIDHEFCCIDFLTVMRWQNLASPFARRFVSV